MKKFPTLAWIENAQKGDDGQPKIVHESVKKVYSEYQEAGCVIGRAQGNSYVPTDAMIDGHVGIYKIVYPEDYELPKATEFDRLELARLQGVFEFDTKLIERLQREVRQQYKDMGVLREENEALEKAVEAEQQFCVEWETAYAQMSAEKDAEIRGLQAWGGYWEKCAREAVARLEEAQAGADEMEDSYNRLNRDAVELSKRYSKLEAAYREVDEERNATNKKCEFMVQADGDLKALVRSQAKQIEEMQDEARLFKDHAQQWKTGYLDLLESLEITVDSAPRRID